MASSAEVITVSERKFSQDGSVTPTRRLKPEWIVYGATAAYVCVFSTLSVMQHASFHTAYDLAGACQGLWALAFGQSQFNTLWGSLHWLNHAYVFSLLVAPIYRFLPSAYLLLFLQTTALALCVPVVYRIALEKTNSVCLSVVLALCYLGYPSLHFANLCEFHWLAFAPLFLLLTFYYANKSPRYLLLFAALALACREGVALTLFPMGIYIALYENRRGGIAVCALSAFWFLVAVGVVVPILSGGRTSPHFAYWAAYGESPAQVVRFVLTHPLQTLHIVFVEHDGLKHIFKVSLFLLFLPLLAPEVLLIALPFFFLRFLSTFELHHTVYFQYSLPEIPIIICAAVIGARRLMQFRKTQVSTFIRHLSPVLLSAALLLCLVATSSLFGAFRPRGQYKRVFERFTFTERSRALREVCRQIPPDAGVSVSFSLTPHLAHRRFVYMFPNPYRRHFWNGVPGDPDYGKYTISEEPRTHLERGREVEWVAVEKNAPTPTGIPSRYANILTGLKQSREFEVVRDNQFVIVLRRVRPPLSSSRE